MCGLVGRVGGRFVGWRVLMKEISGHEVRPNKKKYSRQSHLVDIIEIRLDLN